MTDELHCNQGKRRRPYLELGAEGEVCVTGIMPECVGICRLDQLSWLDSMDRQAEEFSE